MDAQIQEQELPQTSLQYKVVGTRIVAALIDIALFVVLFIVMSVLWGDTGTTSQNGTHNAHVYLTGGPLLLFFVIQFAYFLLLEGLFGATLGKIVTGLKVVAVDGSPVGWTAALIRNVLRFIDALPIFYLVGLIVVAISEKKQRLGDLAGQTLVVRAR